MKSVKAVAPIDHISILGERVRDLEATFSCGGEVTLAAPVELRFRNGQTVRVKSADGWRRNDVGRQLLKRCTPAPFGVGRETRRDPRVRDGAQLLAAGGALRVANLDLQKAGILREIHHVLCPADKKAPTAELYALNVYRRGGHFVVHKDTPRDPEVFGTLVVCLPVEFSGGASFSVTGRRAATIGRGLRPSAGVVRGKPTQTASSGPRFTATSTMRSSQWTTGRASR